MTRGITIWAGALLALGIPASAEKTLTFSQALQRAEAHAERGAARVRLANANLKYLDTQAKPKWELRPQLGVFSFSNPALLASSLGLSVLRNRAQMPSPWTWQSTRFDAAEAEIQQQKAVLDARMRAAQLFFDALAKQQIRDELAATMESQHVELRTVESRTRSTRLTLVERTRREDAVIEMEAHEAEISSAYQSALLRLAAFLDLDGEASESGLRLLEDPAAQSLTGGEEVPAADALIQLALRHRPDLRGIRDRLDKLAGIPSDGRAVGFDPLALGFSHIDQTGNGVAGQPGSNFPLGGNIGRMDLGFRIRLRDNGEGKALNAVASAQRRALELELEGMENSIHWEVKSLRAAAVASIEQARLAARKFEGVDKLSRAIRIREQSGLESREARFTADAELLRVRVQFEEAQGQRKASVFHLIAVCGLEDDKQAAWSSLIER